MMDDGVAELTFGELIKHMRQERGYSNRGFAKRCGISLSHAQYIERDIKQPREKTMKKLARALEVSADWLEAEKQRRDAMRILLAVGVPRRIAHLLVTLQPFSSTESQQVSSTLENIRRDRER